MVLGDIGAKVINMVEVYCKHSRGAEDEQGERFIHRKAVRRFCEKVDSELPHAISPTSVVRLSAKSPRT